MDPRGPLLEQWRRVAAAVPTLDLDAPSRVEGWRNREVVAHLALQPEMLSRFVAAASGAPAELTVADNLAGTGKLAEMVDQAARQRAATGDLDLAKGVEAAARQLDAVDLQATIAAVQGRIRVDDYLVTRCVEAVVHGLDLVPPVDPDPEALAIVNQALTGLLDARAPELVSAAAGLPVRDWVDIATGRRPAPGSLLPAMPLMR